MGAVGGVTRRHLEEHFSVAFEARTGKLPGATRVVECDDLLIIRADETLTPKQGVLSAREPDLTAELSRTVLEELAHNDLWEIAAEQAGRPVTAVLADQSIDPDVAVVCFVLGDEDSGDPAGA
ncbi:MAG: DUF2294 family protein [Solirubrobacterales bacterium]|nr:DUF2294 family protein [Solirubrobacterales bacterium]